MDSQGYRVKLSLSQRVTIPSSVLFVLLQVGLAACLLDHERSGLLRQLDARARHLATRAGLGGTPGRQLGEALLEQEGVVFVEVKTAKGRTLSQDGTTDGNCCRQYSFPIVMLEGSEERAGTLSLALSTARVDRAVTEARGMVVVAILANTALAAFIVALTVRRTIGKPVTRLLKTARVASAGHLRYPTPAQNGDELAQLAGMINTMAAQLQAELAREKIPGAQLISFGPDIHGAHTPQERVSVRSTATFYKALRTLLNRLSS